METSKIAYTRLTWETTSQVWWNYVPSGMLCQAAIRTRLFAPTDKLNELADFCFLTNLSSCTLTGANRCADDTGDLSDPSTLYTASGHLSTVCNSAVLLTQQHCSGVEMND